MTHLPTWLDDQHDFKTTKPLAILYRRIIKHNNQPLGQYLVQYEGFKVHEASWENISQFEAKFPDFIRH